MKKMFFLLTILLVFGLTACSPKEETQNKNESTNETKNEGGDPKETKEPAPSENGSVIENENTKPPVSGNTYDHETENNENEEPATESPEPTTYKNNSFKDVSLTENENGIQVTGKARVFEGVFQYAVVVKDKILKEDHYLTAGAPAWGEFQFFIDQNLLTHPGTTLELFVYSAKDGSKTEVLPIALTEE